MKITERIVLVVLALVLIGGGFWLYNSTEDKKQAVRDAVARGEYEIRPDEKTDKDEKEDWRVHFPELIPIVIASTTAQASVADSLPERIKGLSNTPYLPEGVVKLFAFGAEGEHSIWMKDMNYSIDIIWVAKNGTIVHLAENVSPDTYPKSFASPESAWFVIEANAGFISSNSIVLGDEVVVPQ